MMRELGTTEFPYGAKIVCYVYVGNDGNVTCPHTVGERAQAVDDVANGHGRLFGAWPGMYRTDLFALTDVATLQARFPASSIHLPQPTEQEVAEGAAIWRARWVEQERIFAPTRALIWTLADSGMDSKQIAKRLRDTDAPTMSADGSKWRSTSVDAILSGDRIPRPRSLPQ